MVPRDRRRWAAAGAHTLLNTHPFEQDGRLFAHNGAFGDLERLEQRLAGRGARIWCTGSPTANGFSPSLPPRAGAGGDVGEGITRAVTWIAKELPVLSLNLIVTTATDLWALRYPATHELYVLVRDPVGVPRPGSASGGQEPPYPRPQ